VTPAEVINELRWRQRMHDAALLAEQENADARVLAEHRAARQLADDRAERHDPYVKENAAGLHGSAFSVRADGTKIPY
jgi:hypothetical protein